MELIIDHAYKAEASIKFLKYREMLESFQIGKHVHIWKITYNSSGTEVPAFRTFPDLTLYFFI